VPGPRLFAHGARREARRIAAILRTETTGGLLMLGATALALVWANSPWSDAYTKFSDRTVLGLTLAQWAADGLLAIFFFVAGLELKREFVAGDLRDPRRAALPVAAAVGGMAAPALIFMLINAGGALRGWAVPTATDIAFALAVLGLVNTSLPAGLRTFLLTLAVVDDLLAIVIIAVFYTSSLHVVPLLLALAPLAIFAVLARRGARSWWLLLPPAAATWALVHESGIHATVAGVLLAFVVPVKTGVRYEHRWRPISAGVAVPVFAFFAAGVSVTGAGLGGAVTLGVIAGLVAGKIIGITGATWLVQRFTRAELDGELDWWDIAGMAMLAGVGFTVSLLIGELAFGAGSSLDQQAKVGVLVGSSVAALLGAGLLRVRDRHYRRLLESDS
jgi:NhaA family Na+:H+ antiporter